MTTSSGWSTDDVFDSLVSEHRAGLVRLAVLLGASQADAEDVVQDAVIAVGRRWAMVRPATALPYLRTAVVNGVRDLHRRRRETSGAMRDLPVEDVGVLRLEDDRRFFELVKALPEQQRTIVVLRYSMGVSTAAIARMLGVSAITVRSQSSRALAKLRRDLQERR